MRPKFGSTFLSCAVLTTICACLAIAAPTAMAKTVKYEGPVNLTYIPSPNGFADPMPYIEFKVTFSGKIPKTIPSGTVRTAGLYQPCDPLSPNCTHQVCVNNGLCEPGGKCPADTDGNGTFGNIPIGRKRAFAPYRFGSQSNPITMAGKVGKSSVTGTIRVGESGFGRSCDTGNLTFTVTPGNAPFPG
jgi:hypothetical protein